jgi:hypothetical protein
MMRSSLAILMFAVLSGVGAEPTGAITGLVDKPERVTAVAAIDRTSGKVDKKFAGKIDSKTGRFTIDGLPLRNAYDVVIDCDSSRLEGVDLSVKRSDYEEEQPISKEDLEAIDKSCRSLNKFEDKLDVLAIRGNIQHAAVVVNKLKFHPFVNSSPGEVIWRLELWHFQKPDETWIKTQDEQFCVFYRQRMQKSEYDKKSIVLDPSLGGHRPIERKSTVDIGKIELPTAEPGIRLRAEKDKKPAES